MPSSRQKHPLPEVPVAEMNVLRVWTAPGMFYDRQWKAIDLLTFPDLSSGDLTAGQRSEALERFVELHRPLTSLALFHSIVALEDLIRDMGSRIAGVSGIKRDFPSIGRVATPPKEPSLVNRNYRKVFGVQGVIAKDHEDRISDLRQLRHTIAHHGGLIPPEDVGKFRFYDVKPYHLINPPRDFVVDTARFLEAVGSNYLARLKDVVFRTVVPSLRPIDPSRPPQKLIELIECFNYFGNLLESEPPARLPSHSGLTYEEKVEEIEKAQQKQAERYKERLLALC